MENTESPLQGETAQEGTKRTDTREAKDERQKDARLPEAKKFIDENAEAIEKAVTEAVKVYKESRRGDRAPSIQSVNGLKAFYKDAAVQKVFELYNRGDESTKRYVYRAVSEAFDKATEGAKDQVIVRRELLRITPVQIRDRQGYLPKTKEDFQKLLQEEGLATMGVDAVADEEIKDFFKENEKPLKEAVRLALKSPTGGGIEGWIKAQKNRDPKVKINASDCKRYLEGTAFFEYPSVQIMQELYTRSEGAERNPKMAKYIEEQIEDVIRTSGSPLYVMDEKNAVILAMVEHAVAR